MTLWYPDTCACQVQYDDDLKHVSSPAKCAKHAAHDGQDHFDAVLAHNRAKNAVLNDLVANGVDATSIAVTYDQDEPTDDDPITVTGLPAADKKSRQAALNAKFGAGKVKVA